MYNGQLQGILKLIQIFNTPEKFARLDENELQQQNVKHLLKIIHKKEVKDIFKEYFSKDTEGSTKKEMVDP